MSPTSSTLLIPTFIQALAIAVLFLFVSVKTVSAEKLPLKIYTSADGLGSSASFNIFRDSRGFIWLCSRDGLVRFDGYRFTTYRIGDELADPAVFSLLPTRSGEYWINLNRGTDYKFTPQPETRELYHQPQSGDLRVPFQAEPIPDGGLPSFEDDDGNLWAVNGDRLHRMYKAPDGYRTEVSPIELPGNPTGMLVVAEFRDARVGDGFWVGTNWGVMRRFADGRMVHTSVSPEGNSDVVRPFVEDAEGRLWVARNDGFIVLKAKIDSDSRSVISDGAVSEIGGTELPNVPGQGLRFNLTDLLTGFSENEKNAANFSKPIVTSLFVSGDGKVWITTNQGLVTYDGGRFRHYTTANGFASNDLGAMTEGPDGSIWIVSYGGLHRLNPTGMRTYDDFDGAERARIHNIFENGKGQLVTVSGNYNVGVFEGSKFKAVRPNIPKDEIFTWQSSVGFRDSRGALWLWTNKRVYRFDDVEEIGELEGREPDATFDETNGLVGGTVVKIFEDSGGNIWFSCFQSGERRGLTRLDRQTGEFKNFLVKDGLPEGAVATGFAEDSDGSLWFSFVEGGLARYRNGQFAIIKSDTAPTAGSTAMFRDSKNRLWIATNREGLVVVEDSTSDAPTFRRFTTADGLTSNNIRAITEDNFGNIYVGTVRGVNRLSPETGRVIYYGTADGLASDFVSSIFRDRAGDIWIGTFNGLSRLTPMPDRTSSALGALISGLRIAGENYSVSPLGQTQIFLPAVESGGGNVQVDFLSTASNYNSPARYQYRFAGQDDWSQPSAESTVNFAGLQAGELRLEVRAVNEHGIASEQPAVVHLTVLRPVWQRWWFLLLLAVAVATTAYLLYRYRVRQLLKLERIRTRIASDLHDDIGSSLSQIAILSEVAKQKAGANGASEPLSKIAETSREMVDSMSDIVWAINPQKDTLGDLMSRMRRFAEDMLDAKDVAYKFDFGGSDEGIALGTDTRRDAYLIFKEALNNVVKHANAVNVNIFVDVSRSNVRFAIADDGVGYTSPADPDETFPGFGGNGLINMRRRAEQHGGSFSFASTPGNGTKVSFSLPLKAGKAVKMR